MQEMSCIIEAEAPISLDKDGKGREEEGEGTMLSKQDTYRGRYSKQNLYNQKERFVLAQENSEFKYEQLNKK